MRTLIQIVSAVIFLALMLALRWGLSAAEWAWPEHGLAAAFAVGVPMVFAVAFWIDRHENGKTKDFWGNPIAAGIDYDFDAQAETFRTRVFRWYIRGCVLVACGLWFFAVYKVFT